jgi:hypothetical protein
MKRWEYLEVFVRQHLWRDSAGRWGHLPDVPSMKDAQGRSTQGFPSMAQVLNDLGDDGWEVVSFAAAPDGNSYWQFLLKRPKG